MLYSTIALKNQGTTQVVAWVDQDSAFDQNQEKGHRNCQILANLLAARIGFFAFSFLEILDELMNDASEIRRMTDWMKEHL